jgi:hypothetical protein
MTPALAVLKSDRFNLTAATPETFYVAQPFAGTWRARAAYLVPHDATASNGTNYVTVALSANATVLGTLSTAATANVAGTARAFTLAGGTAGEVAQGASYTVAVTHSGTGASIDGYVIVELEKVGR